MILGMRQYQVLKYLSSGDPKASGEFEHLPIKRNTVHAMLVRLEKRKLVSSFMSDPEPRRGGKARRIFLILPAGEAAVREFEKQEINR
jgi:DNA-binding MarR family transcriptional regulator